MFQPATLFLSGLFSLIGMGYFIYGKKQIEPTFLWVGALLMVYPYFISGAWLLFLVGLILSSIPFVASRFSS